MDNHLFEIVCTEDLDAGCDRGFVGVFLGNERCGAAFVSRGDHLGECATHRSQAPVEGKLGNEDATFDRFGFNRARRCEDADCNREV